MATLVKLRGTKCNLQCHYCYQHSQREIENIHRPRNLEKVKESIEKAGEVFTLFGGEPLLSPKKELREIWSWGFQKYAGNDIQTNGVLIDDEHIHMFKQYNVNVGISVDGPIELNDARWAGNLERTRQASTKVQAVIEQLCKNGISMGLIVTLHRGNATQEKLPTMCNWFKYLNSIGVIKVRLRVLEVNNEFIRQKHALSIQENLDALLSFFKLEKELTVLKFDIFQDMYNMLLGQDDKSICVWQICDIYTTCSAKSIETDGQQGNCGPSNSDGIEFVKSDLEGFERYLALYHTPQEYGGCKDCRFFLMCKGQCPSTAIDNDWRNRSEYCQVWKELYNFLEEELIEKGLIPISIRPNLKQLEQDFLDALRRGHRITLSHLLKQLNSKDIQAKKSRI